MPVAEADVADALLGVSGNIPQFFPLQAFLWALKEKVLKLGVDSTITQKYKRKKPNAKEGE